MERRELNRRDFLKIAGATASGILIGSELANVDSAVAAVLSAPDVQFDPGKMLIDFEIKKGSRAFISANHAVCEVMGDTVLTIDGKKVDTKEGFKGNPKVGSISRTYNRNFDVEAYADIDILCGPMLPEVLSFMDKKHGDFVENMRRIGCVNGCDLVNVHEYGDRTTLRSQDPGSMLIDIELKADSSVFLSAKHWRCSVMGDTVITVDGRTFDTKEGAKGNPKVGSFTVINGKDFTVDTYADIDILCAPKSIPAAEQFLANKDQEFIDRMKKAGCVGGCDDVTVRRIAFNSRINEINSVANMSYSDLIRRA